MSAATILLVDDEDMVKDVGKMILERLGYAVLTASSGEEALALFTRERSAIHLVILDMIMPDMGGGETYDGLRRIDADVKVLLSSGYSLDHRAQEILDRGCDGFIQKPFTVQELSSKISAIIS